MFLFQAMLVPGLRSGQYGPGMGLYGDQLLPRILNATMGLGYLHEVRDRAADIPLLARRFLQQFGGPNPPGLAPDAIDLLGRYPWPGNVRELKNVMERAVLLAKGPLIRASDLTLQIPSPDAVERTSGPAISLAELERRHIESVLHETSWHQGRAAAALGISSKTLYRKIREYGFRRPGGVD